MPFLSLIYRIVYDALLAFSPCLKKLLMQLVDILN